jgi:response regulator RpfG family c-di-GMP phosphodiesterase
MTSKASDSLFLLLNFVYKIPVNMEETRILLVEDEKKIAEALKKGLTENQYQVEVAYDGLVGKKLFGYTGHQPPGHDRL